MRKLEILFVSFICVQSPVHLPLQLQEMQRRKEGPNEDHDYDTRMPFGWEEIKSFIEKVWNILPMGVLEDNGREERERKWKWVSIVWIIIGKMAINIRNIFGFVVLYIIFTFIYLYTLTFFGTLFLSVVGLFGGLTHTLLKWDWF